MITPDSDLEAGVGESRSRAFAFTAVALIVCFVRPLYQLVKFAISSELYSHIVLIPFISAYLVWPMRKSLHTNRAPNRKLSVIFAVMGLLALAGFWAAAARRVKLETEDSLALTTLSFVLLFLGTCTWFLSKDTLRKICFPLGFLLLMVPLPVRFTSSLDTFLQYGSADVALVLFNLFGTPVFHQDLTLQLPGISLEVAPQCSGIHSSLALFITSLLAGYFFLRSFWKRGALLFAVLPLAIRLALHLHPPSQCPRPRTWPPPVYSTAQFTVAPLAVTSTKSSACGLFQSNRVTVPRSETGFCSSNSARNS